jgi:large subunit ribosomal protein L1
VLAVAFAGIHLSAAQVTFRIAAEDPGRGEPTEGEIGTADRQQGDPDMPKPGKRYQDAAKLIDRTRAYPPDEAAELIKQTSAVNFDPSIEAHLRLGVDPRHADQMVRGTVVLPHGTGKVVRVAVFAQGDKAQEALRAGADEVGAEDLVKRIEAGWLEFDVALAAPDVMGMVGRLGRILGRRGLMPNPKSGTITFDLDRAIREVKSGRVEFKVDKGGIVHVSFGKGSFEAPQLVENLTTLIDAINRAKPSGAKGQYLKSLTIASTMGPGVRVDIPAVLAAAAA